MSTLKLVTDPPDAWELAERFDQLELAVATVPTTDFARLWGEIQAEKEELRIIADAWYEINPEHPVCLRFNQLGEALKEAWPLWRQAWWNELSPAEKKAGFALRRRESNQIRRLRGLIARATHREDRKADSASRDARSARTIIIGRNSCARRAGSTTKSGSDPGPGDQPPPGRPLAGRRRVEQAVGGAR